MARINRPISTLVTAVALCLAPSAFTTLHGRDGHADRPVPAPEPKVFYSLDQESGAPLFASGQVQTDGFLAWMKEKNLPVSRLVLSSRIIRGELDGLDEPTRKAKVDKIKAAAATAKIKLIRLSIISAKGEPSIASPIEEERKKAVAQHVKLAKLAAELGCSQVSVLVESSGFYEDQKKAAKGGLAVLMAGMKEDNVNGIEVLVSNGPGLSDNGVWLRQVLDEIRGDKKDVNIGLLLDVDRLDYNPKTAFGELTTPAKKKDQSQPVTPVTNDASRQVTPNPEVNRDPPTTPNVASEPPCDLKAIVFESYDSNGDVEVSGLSDKLSRALLGKAKFQGDISIRYRGKYQAGITSTHKKLIAQFGKEEAETAPQTTPKPETK